MEYKGKTNEKISLFIALILSMGVQALSLSGEPAVKNQNFADFLGEKVRLLDTYQNSESMLADLNSSNGYILEELRSKYNLPNLSENSATSYKRVVTDEIMESQTERLSDLLDFLDYFENVQENEQILNELSKLEQAVENGEISKSEALISGRAFLPIYEENKNSDLVFESRNSGIILYEARKYAEKYAPEGKYNRKYGYETKWVGVDCTNFASQILHAGGVSMIYSSSTNSGWWWRSPDSRSASWVNAHVFSNYMGKGYNAKYWMSLVANVRDGDFIAADWSSDGVIDHIGFVHTKNGGKLLIAQHSIDYLKWDGGWPDYSGKATYYRVRR